MTFGKMLLRNFSHNRDVTFINRSFFRLLHILHTFFHTVMSTVKSMKNFPFCLELFTQQTGRTKGRVPFDH